ncbi:hypothetical protein ACFSSF_08355 [Dietzia aerolata]|uniref:DUF7059 domain-containing protein n=1 Tax=Dietzia aerolata TaxID=595984 RepID=UPI00363E94DC
MTGSSTSLATLASDLAAAFRRHDYTVEGLERALGEEAVSALARSDAAVVRRHARGAGAPGALLRLFVLGDALPGRRSSPSCRPPMLPPVQKPACGNPQVTTRCAR